MKKSKHLFLAFLILLCHSASYSQKITTGIYSGVNFSDIHGQEYGEKWCVKPGPSEGFSLGYDLNNSIGIKTGLNYSTVYYEKKYTSYPQTVYPAEYSMYPVYYPQTDLHMDFSSLSIPLLLTVSVPSEIRFTMQAGVFFYFIQNYDLNTGYSSSSVSEKVRRKDFGYIFSSGLSYPLSEKLEVCLNMSYLTGKRHFLENSNYRQGSSLIAAGLNFNFNHKEKTRTTVKAPGDTVSKTVTVTYRGGVNYSWNSFSTDIQKYSNILGPSLGFDLNVPLGKRSYFITGVSFERKGYSMKDSSSSFYMRLKNTGQLYTVNSSVLIDYAVIPFLISFPLSRYQDFYFSAGPWIGLRLNARNTGVAYYESRTSGSYTYTKTIVYDDMEKLTSDKDLGLIYRFGLKVPIASKFKLEMAVQYSQSYRNAFNNKVLNVQGVIPSEDLKIRNRTVSFVLGFTLPSPNHK